MIWHIFKKDVRLTWHLVAVAAGLHWLTAILATIVLNNFFELKSPPLAVLLLGGLVARGVAIMAVVQHDPIPGVSQDWLVRPIRRRDLLLAKLLFVVLMVQLPGFLADIGASLASGFSFSLSFNAAVQHSVLQLLIINIPLLAFASITRNFLDVLSGGVLIGLVAGIVLGLTPASPYLTPVWRTGLSWILTATACAVLVIGAGMVLGLQYFRRRTRASRLLTGCITGLLLIAQFMPWGPVFAFQRSLASAPGSSRDIALNFDPSAGRYKPPAGSLTEEDALSVLKHNDQAFDIYLPFLVTGLPADSGIGTDHSEVRLIEPNGRVERLELGRWNLRPGAADSPVGPVYPKLEIPAVLYQRIRNQPVRLEVDHWLTFVQLSSSHFLPAIDGHQQIPAVGRCGTTINSGETAVRLSCIEAGTPATCLSYFLEHTPTGTRNPERFGCGTYSPLDMNTVVPISLTAFGANLLFRDAAGLTKFPIDGSKLGESRVVIQIYNVKDHFARKLVIPEIRLSEWEAERPAQ